MSYLFSAAAGGLLVAAWVLAPIGIVFFLGETLRWHREAMERVRRAR